MVRTVLLLLPPPLRPEPSLDAAELPRLLVTPQPPRLPWCAAPTDPTPEHADNRGCRLLPLLLLSVTAFVVAGPGAAAAGAEGILEAPVNEWERDGRELPGTVAAGERGMPDAVACDSKVRAGALPLDLLLLVVLLRGWPPAGQQQTGGWRQCVALLGPYALCSAGRRVLVPAPKCRCSKHVQYKIVCWMRPHTYV